MSKHILFLDTETTGLPSRWNAPYNKGAHNAMNDVEATKECYFCMVKKGYF